MDFLEKDLEELLFSTPKETIRERGMHSFMYDQIFRQVNLGVYGILDLVTIERYSAIMIIKVYELKNKKLNPSAFWQTVRYIKAIKHILSKINLRNHIIEIKGIMVGREIDLSGDFCFLPTIHSDVEMYTYKYDLNGLYFNHVRDNYIHTQYNGGFNFKKLNNSEHQISFIKTILNPPPF